MATVKKNISRTTTHPALAPPPGAIRPTPSWPAGTAEALIRLWDGGHSAAEVARRLGTSMCAVESKVRKLRVAGYGLAARRPVRCGEPQRARRKCLYCGHGFASTHIGNRICPTCLEEGPFGSAMETVQLCHDL